MKKITILSLLSLCVLFFSACSNSNADANQAAKYLQSGNYDKAFEYFQKAANQNNQYGEAGLADMYAQGLGVSQDSNKAFYYYQRSAQKGNSNAQLSLAVCYSEGIGTPVNDEEAIRWLKKSAAQGNPSAIEILNSL